MALTPVEVRHIQLKRGLFGYRKAAVHRMMDDIADSFETVWRERSQLVERVEELETEVTRHVELEGLLRSTLVSAERASQDLKEAARREADVIVTEANAEARKVLRDAITEKEQLMGDVRRVQALLRSALAVVDETPAQAAPADEIAAADDAAAASAGGDESPGLVDDDPRIAGCAGGAAARSRGARGDPEARRLGRRLEVRPASAGLSLGHGAPHDPSQPPRLARCRPLGRRRAPRRRLEASRRRRPRAWTRERVGRRPARGVPRRPAARRAYRRRRRLARQGRRDRRAHPRRGGAAPRLGSERNTMTIDLALRRAELLRLRERILRAAADLAADDEGVGEINSAAGDSAHRRSRDPTSSTSRSTSRSTRTPTTSSPRSTTHSGGSRTGPTGRAPSAAPRSRRSGSTPSRTRPSASTTSDGRRPVERARPRLIRRGGSTFASARRRTPCSRSRAPSAGSARACPSGSRSA